MVKMMQLIGHLRASERTALAIPRTWAALYWFDWHHNAAEHSAWLERQRTLQARARALGLTPREEDTNV